MIVPVAVQLCQWRKRRISNTVHSLLNHPCATFRLHGAGGGGVHRNILPSTPVVAKRMWADGRGTGVSSQDEAFEEATVGTVGQGGGRPGPHPKPNKG